MQLLEYNIKGFFGCRQGEPLAVGPWLHVEVHRRKTILMADTP